MALVDVRLVPILEKGGFCRVECQLDDPEIYVKGSEIILEGPGEDSRQYIEFVFHKYRAPCFLVRFGEMRSVEPGIFRVPWVSALVRRRNQGCHFWGKPWWVPRPLWTDADAERYVAHLVPMMDQILRFLDTGERGRNIREPWFERPPRIESAAPDGLS